MSEFLEPHDGISRVELRKRNVRLENRRLSRLPHPLTWIEFNFPKFFDRLTRKGYGVDFVPGFEDKQPDKMGWLLEQHPTNAAAFRRTEIHSFANEGVAHLHPVSMAWCSDDEPSPWRLWPAGCLSSEDAVVQGYCSTQAHLIATFRDDISNLIFEEWCRGHSQEEINLLAKNATTLRTTWGLLSTINDLPISIEHIKPSRGYVARGSYKKFLQHAVVHLTVPETEWRKLVSKTATLLRKRAHQVRGHWRKDWRHPLFPLCDPHEFDDQMVYRRCHGHKVWVHEHQRGDASIGFVTHDYEVHHPATEEDA
jgi:hypothetical protein